MKRFAFIKKFIVRFAVSILIAIMAFGPHFSISQDADSKLTCRGTKPSPDLLRRYRALKQFGDNLKSRGHNDSAIVVFRQALLLAQNNFYFDGLEELCNSIGNTYFEIGNNKVAEKYFWAALSVANCMKDQVQLGEIYNNLGKTYLNLGQYPKSKKFYLRSSACDSITMYNKGLMANYNGLGNVAYSQGLLPEALKYYFVSLRLSEQLQDTIMRALNYNNIGNTYFSQGNILEAMVNYKQSLALREAVKDSTNIGVSLMGIGMLYGELGKSDTALSYLNAAFDILRRFNLRNYMAYCTNNIGNMFYDRKEFDRAFQYYKKSTIILEEGGDLQSVVACYINLGDVLGKMGDNIKGMIWLEKALNLSLKIGFRDRIKQCYLALSSADSAMASANPPGAENSNTLWKSSLDHYKLFICYNDSLNNEENTKKTVEQQMNYEFDKKESEARAMQEKKDALVQEESRKQKIILYAVSLGLLLVLILAGVIFRSLRMNQKKSNIIRVQKEAVQHQKELIEEKQKEILDSITYARRIQRSLLTSERYIGKQLLRLISK